MFFRSRLLLNAIIYACKHFYLLIVFLLIVPCELVYANQPDQGFSIAGGRSTLSDSTRVLKVEKQIEQVKTMARLSFIIPFIGSIIGIATIGYALFVVKKLRKMEDADPGKRRVLMRYIILSAIASAFWIFALYSLFLIL